MDTSVPVLCLKPEKYNQGRPIGISFRDDFGLENGATAIGTVPTIGHGPTYGWVNSKRASQMYTRNQYDFKLN